MSRSDTQFSASELARREYFARELERLTARIEELNRAHRGVYTTGMKQQLRAERDRLIADRVALQKQREAYLMRSTNPLEAVWNQLREHPFWALVLVFTPVMIMAGPQAMAGYAMIIGTLWFLVACIRGIKRHRARRLDVAETIMEVPGGLLRIPGKVPPEQLEAFHREWMTVRRSGARTAVLDGDVRFEPCGPMIPERVSAMRADGAPVIVDDTVDGVHPRLPSWMRTAWDGALAEYRTRVQAEGTWYRELKEEFSTVFRAVVDRDSMIDWARREVTTARRVAPESGQLQRIERGLEAISPEGARYGELLFRARRGEDIRKYATEDGELIVDGRRATPSPEMPRSFVPMLDRAFELTTDCRYHHVAEHALVETAAHPGYVVRTCTICAPATFWIERA